MSHELCLLLHLTLSTSEPTRRNKRRSGFIISQPPPPPPSRNKTQSYITQISPKWQQPPPPPLRFPLPCISSVCIYFSIFFGLQANCLLIPRSLKQLNTVCFYHQTSTRPLNRATTSCRGVSRSLLSVQNGARDMKHL